MVALTGQSHPKGALNSHVRGKFPAQTANNWKEFTSMSVFDNSEHFKCRPWRLNSSLQCHLQYQEVLLNIMQPSWNTRKHFRFIVTWKTTGDTLTQIIHVTICPNFLNFIHQYFSFWLHHCLNLCCSKNCVSCSLSHESFWLLGNSSHCPDFN